MSPVVITSSALSSRWFRRTRSTSHSGAGRRIRWLLAWQPFVFARWHSVHASFESMIRIRMNCSVVIIE